MKFQVFGRNSIAQLNRFFQRSGDDGAAVGQRCPGSRGGRQDIQLPDQNGLAVYCEIRELDRRIPVIFMTVEAASNTAIEAIQFGAFHYIAKPLSVGPLFNLVEKAIEQRLDEEDVEGAVEVREDAEH